MPPRNASSNVALSPLHSPHPSPLTPRPSPLHTLSHVHTLLPLVLIAGLSLCLAGCEEKAKKIERPSGTLSKKDAKLQQTALAAAMQGTIGSVAYAEGGLRLMRVRGYGLVTGLAGKGSRRCPESLRAYLADSIRRTRLSDPYRHKSGNEPSPDKLISSPDTAVVLVEAEIPAGASKGRLFDVRVETVDEDTQSLAGGILLQTDLKVFQSVSPTSVIEGRTLAHAGGPIFINPFRQATATATSVNLHEGSIIAGGVNVEDRKLTLATTIESYATVRQIQDNINVRFRTEPPTATAQSPRSIELRVPLEFRGREGRFLALLMHLPLNNSQAELQARAKLLTAELSQPDAPHHDLALSLEGLGTPAIDFIRPLYAHANRQVNFAAASTGVRLGDDAALDVLIRHAKDPRSTFRYQAIRELGESRMSARSAATLQELLDGTDSEVRVLAYEALRLVDRSAIVKKVVGERPENFLLEIVPTNGTPLIYATRSKAPRIALIGGERLSCNPPLLYSDSNSQIVLTAKTGDKMVSILRKDPKRTLGPYYSPLSVPIFTHFLGNDLRTDLNGKLNGLGLDYGSVVAVLYRLCQSKAIPADMKWEEPNSDQLLGPMQPMGRPESEL